MTDETSTSASAGITRRSLIGGIGVAAGAASLGGRAAVSAPSRVLASAPQGVAAPADFGPLTRGLVYLPLDAFAFDTANVTGTPYRLYQQATGMQPSSSSGEIYAPVSIPTGSVIKDLRFSFLGRPVVYLARRVMGTQDFATAMSPIVLPAGGGAKAHVASVAVEILESHTYSVVVSCNPGDSILGMMIGYIPPAQAFIPFSGLDPRVLDTRSGSKFAAGEVRVVDLSSRLIPFARAAVINLTATATSGPGFLSAFADGIPFPGNSTVNYNGANESVANGAVVTMADGKIKVRCGDSASHVIVDVIGSLL
jgi:hypothetical protein